MATFNKKRKAIRVYDLQNIFDFTLQEYGSIEAISKVLSDNNINADDVISSGQELFVRTNRSELVNPTYVDILKGRNTYLTNATPVVPVVELFAIHQNGDGFIFQNGDTLQW